jgi:hypothetical protein
MAITFTPKGGPSTAHAPAPEANRTTVQAHTRPQKSYGTALAEKMAAAKTAPPQPTSPSIPHKQAEAIAAAPVDSEQAPLSPQFAALARQTAALRKAQQALKQEQDRLKAQESSYIPRERFQQDPLAVLAELGITNDRLVELQLNQAGSSDPLQSELKALRAELEAIKSSSQEQVTSQYQQALRQIASDAELLVNNDPTYEITKATGNTQSVVELIEAVFQRDGVVLSVEDAAKEVEDALLENSEQSIKQLSALSKIKARLEAKAPEANQGPMATQGASTQAEARPTLTNRLGSTKPMTARDRAIAAIEQRLIKQ